MDKRQNSPSVADYVDFIEGNLFAWLPVFGRLGRVTGIDPYGVTRTITNYPISLFNSIMRTDLMPDDMDGAIQYIISDGQARKVPLLWWVVPSTRPLDLGDHLLKFGFQLDDNDPGMAVDLHSVEEKLPMPEDFSISLAKGDQAWQEWSRTMFAGFEFPSPGETRLNAWSDMLKFADPDTVLAYTGYLKGKPVATSILLLGAGTAGIYSVGTIPEARRRGIGAWMTLHPLLQARLRGYKVGVLFASPIGLGVYRSLGFQEYCKIASYRWAPPQ